jgi:hypothetical protein
VKKIKEIMHFMKKPYLFLIFCLSVTNLFAQKEAFDLFAYTPPAGWKKEVTENIIIYTHINNETKSWCRIGIVKSTISKGSIEADFKSEWQDLIVKNYNPSEAPVLNEVHETDGWKIKEGVAKFKFNNADAQAMLTTISGFDRCASIVVTINSPEYLEEIDAFLTSVDFKTMETTTQPALAGNNAAWNGFSFTTTNFDDGWTSTIQDDWVQVSKGNIKVLIHYPNKKADTYNSVLLDGLQNAWNILVAPKYNRISNLEFKPVSG